MPTRFRDQGKSYYRMDHSLQLVRCPQCDGLARVVRLDRPTGRADTYKMWWPRRPVCGKCGHTRTREEVRSMGFGQGRDPYFGLALWLQAPCSGQLLWAWNPWHLDCVERFVAADLPERIPNINGSLASSLPQWLKSAKHRDEILKAIQKLRATLPAWAHLRDSASESSG